MTTRLDEIVVPLDGSRTAEAAIPIALTLATRLKRQVTLVTVCEETTFALSAEILSSDLNGALVEGAREYLKSVRERIAATSSVTVEIDVLLGNVRKRLSTFIEQRKSRFIVMTTHGYGPIDRMWLGSVADYVVRHVEVPVVLVRPDMENIPPFEAEAVIGRIAVALDGSEVAERILGPVVALAKAIGAVCEVVRVVPSPFLLQSVYLPDQVNETQRALERGEHEAKEYLDEVVQRLAGCGVKAHASVVVGKSPATGILHCAADTKSDMVALTTHGRSGLVRMVLGSVADKVIRGAPVPVLAVRPETVD